MNNNSNDNNDHIKLEIKDQKLIDRRIVQSFELDKKTNTIILEINTLYDKTTIPVTFLRNKMTWQSFLRDLDTGLIEIAGIDNEEDRKLIKRTVNYYHDEIIEEGKGEGRKTNKTREFIDSINGLLGDKDEEKEGNEKTKREFITYKYSQMGKGSLHEAVIINGLPFFIKYNHISKEFELVENITENSRILRPPNIEEYPYTPYEFGSNEELSFFFEKAREITLDELYNKCKSIFLRYVDQDEHIISLLS